MNLSEQLRLLYEKKKNVYQNYEYPISISDMKDTYKRFNKELFGNKLPDVRLKFAPLAKNFYGKYHHTYNPDNTAKDRLITMASVTRKDNEQFENTLIHEMIHVWQYWMEEKTGDDKYLDDEGFTGMAWFLNPEKDKHKRGHGKYFQSEMKRVNKLGYAIRIESDMQIEKELLKPVWVILFHSDTEKGVFVYSVVDPKNKIDEIISNLEEVAGAGFFTSYTIIKTTDTVANTGLRLTGSFELPKNSKNIYVSSQIVANALSKSKLSTLVGGSNIAPSGKQNQSMSPENVQLLQRIHNARHVDFKSYIAHFLSNSVDYAKLVETDAYKANNWGSELRKWQYGQDIKGVPKEVIEAVRNDWMNISDVEIKKAFKFLSSDVYYALTSSNGNLTIDDKFIKKFMTKYEDDFKGRVSMERFKGVFYKVTLAEIKKRFKKFKKEFVEKDILALIKGTVLKGTILERYTLSEQIRAALAERIDYAEFKTDTRRV